LAAGWRPTGNHARLGDLLDRGWERDGAMPEIDSSAISRIGYQKPRRLLYVTYKGSGGSYVYIDVPPREYQALLKAESKGTFINKRIKPHYRCQRLGEA
jgi:hypothetical protein